MKTLWTPWRIEHVQGTTEAVEGCLFEPSGDMPWDRDALLLYRDRSTLVLLNRFPYSNGHLLVAPIRHLSCLSELSPREGAALMSIVSDSCRILRHCYNPDGFNVGCNLGSAAGAGIADHLHFHIVPRWEGDHNYMTVLAEVRTIPEHILSTFDRLLPSYQDLYRNNTTDHE